VALVGKSPDRNNRRVSIHSALEIITVAREVDIQETCLPKQFSVSKEFFSTAVLTKLLGGIVSF